MTALSTTPPVLKKPTRLKTSAALLLTCFFVVVSSAIQAQIVCDNDGIEVEFDERNGVVELKEVKVKQIAGGNNDDDREVSLGGSALQTVNYSGGALTVNGLNVSAFPDNGIGSNSIFRSDRNVWTASYPKGMYEFANKNDLILEFEISVAGGQASHIVVGPSSSASVSIDSADIDAKFHGGNPKSLKQLRGDLNFVFTNLLQLTTAGTHRADVSLCVNVRGTI